MKQPIMRRVVYALIPLFLFSIVLYGWRPILLALVIFPTAIFLEWVLEKIKKTPKTQVSEAVLVTASLYTLSLPPGVPLYVAILGIAFGVVFAKEVFGGFGRNVFNPAIAARMFAYLAFPAFLGTLWFIPFNPVNYHPATLIMDFVPPSVFKQWTSGADVITTATTMDALRAYAEINKSQIAFLNSVSVSTGAPAGIPKMQNAHIPESWLGMFLGVEPGSMGETSVLLIILAGIYLVFTPVKKKNKDGTTALAIQPTANWILIVSTLLSSFLMLSFLYFLPEWIPGIQLPRRLHPILGMLSGSILYVAVFMTTDPITAPKKATAQWAYGFLIGAISILIRVFSGFPEGVSFAILVGNMFSSLFDETIGQWGEAKKPVSVPKAPAEVKT
jgi:Na+-transporting NADH:ubiquinone oxidoreductase subunit B